jgi:hypothetical protein
MWRAPRRQADQVAADHHTTAPLHDPATALHTREHSRDADRHHAPAPHPTCTPPAPRRAASRQSAGVATSGTCRDIKIRNLNTRHALNDGFNIHGDCRGFHASKISAYECFDEGFSAHDASQTTVEDGLFWGNDHAIADVNAAETRYLRCEFRDSLSVEVFLSGRAHHLEDCRLIASAHNAFTLRPGTDLKSRTPLHATCLLKNLTVTGSGPSPHSFDSSPGTTLTLDSCTLSNITLKLLGDHPSTATTLDGKPWP